MAIYYVNKNAQLNGDHEVHQSGCIYVPNDINRKYIGEFRNCEDAVKEAKKIYVKSEH